MLLVEAQTGENPPQSVVSEKVLKSIEKNFHRQPLAQRLEQVSHNPIALSILCL